MHTFQFTFENIKSQYKAAVEAGYKVITCQEYADLKGNNHLPEKTLVNRVDIDLSVKKAERLGIIFRDLGIKATFFVRLHAPEYNPFSFENYRIIRFLIECGNEIGYHSEIVDQEAIWNEEAKHCLIRDLSVIDKMYGIQVKGVASHGGSTGLNNLDFWKKHKPKEFGLLYEAYDHEPEFNLFQESFYISDSEWTRWKCYDRGKLCEGDRRSLEEHIRDGHSLLHVLIHPDTYFDRHFYE
jgi:hypothetical protein